MPPKPFLRRGEGISRFEQGGLAQARAEALAKARRARRPPPEEQPHSDWPAPSHAHPASRSPPVKSAPSQKATERAQARAEALARVKEAKGERGERSGDEDVVSWAPPRPALASSSLSPATALPEGSAESSLPSQQHALLGSNGAEALQGGSSPAPPSSEEGGHLSDFEELEEAVRRDATACWHSSGLHAQAEALGGEQGCVLVPSSPRSEDPSSTSQLLPRELPSPEQQGLQSEGVANVAREYFTTGYRYETIHPPSTRAGGGVDVAAFAAPRQLDSNSWPNGQGGVAASEQSIAWGMGLQQGAKSPQPMGAPPTSALVASLFPPRHQPPSPPPHQPASPPAPARGGGRGAARGGHGGKPYVVKAAATTGSKAAAGVAEAEAENLKLRKRLAAVQEKLSQATERLEQQALEDPPSANGAERGDMHALETAVAEFEEYKANELKRLARDRRVLERQAKAVLKVPDRREREEMDGLRAEIESLKKELQLRDARAKMAIERLKKQLASLTAERDELQGEVSYLTRKMADASLPPANVAGGVAVREGSGEAHACVCNSQVRRIGKLPPRSVTFEDEWLEGYDSDEPPLGGACEQAGQAYDLSRAASSSAGKQLSKAAAEEGWASGACLPQPSEQARREADGARKQHAAGQEGEVGGGEGEGESLMRLHLRAIESNPYFLDVSNHLKDGEPLQDIRSRQ